jgi:hypothetical protein
MHNPPHTIELFCCVLDIPGDPFPVEIEDRKNVGHFKREIVKYSLIAFANVNISEVRLWKVSDCLSALTASYIPFADERTDAH